MILSLDAKMITKKRGNVDCKAVDFGTFLNYNQRGERREAKQRELLDVIDRRPISQIRSHLAVAVRRYMEVSFLALERSFQVTLISARFRSFSLS